MRLHVYIVERLCWEAKGRGGMAEEVDEQSKSRTCPFSSFHPITLGSAPHRKTVCVQASPFGHWCKQRKLHVAFLPFEYRRLPPLILGLWHARISWILPSNTKKPHTVVGRCMCIHTHARKAEWGPEYLYNCSRAFKWIVHFRKPLSLYDRYKAASSQLT